MTVGNETGGTQYSAYIYSALIVLPTEDRHPPLVPLPHGTDRRGSLFCGQSAETYLPAGINQSSAAALKIPPVVCTLPW